MKKMFGTTGKKSLGSLLETFTDFFLFFFDPLNKYRQSHGDD